MTCHARVRSLACLSLLVGLAAGPLAGSSLSAQEDPLQFTLANPTQSVGTGTTVMFLPTLQNLDSAHSISLDSSTFTFATLTDPFASTLALLSPQGQSGDHWAGDLFDVSVNPGLASGTVLLGSYTVDYSVNGTTFKCHSQLPDHRRRRHGTGSAGLIGIGPDAAVRRLAGNTTPQPRSTDNALDTADGATGALVTVGSDPHPNPTARCRSCASLPSRPWTLVPR